MNLVSPLRLIASAALVSLAGAFATSPALAIGVVGVTDTFGNNNFNGWARSQTDSSGSTQGSVTTFNLPGHGYVVWMQGQCCGSNQSVDAYITKTFDTSGYTSLTLQFDWEGYSTERSNPPNQLLYVQWRPTGTSNWITLNSPAFNLYPAGDWDSESLNLFTNHAAYDQIDIRFYTNVNDNNDSAKLDNILLTGTQEAPDPTPLPGALPLFMSGAAVFGGLVYRRKRKQQAAA